jgi:hypothetical protein
MPQAMAVPCMRRNKPRMRKYAEKEQKLEFSKEQLFASCEFQFADSEYFEKLKFVVAIVREFLYSNS